MLDLIIEDNGGNRKGESKRGKLFCAPPEEPECIHDVVSREETVVDAVDEEDLDAEPGFDEEFDAAREAEAEAEAAGGWAC